MLRGRWLIALLLPAAGLAYACGSFDGADTGTNPGGPVEAGGPDAALEVAPRLDGGGGVSCAISVVSEATPDANCLGPTMPAVALESSPLHCGRCGHSCLGAACANGFCAPENLQPAAVAVALGDVSADHAYYLTGPDVQRVAFLGRAVEVVARTTRQDAFMTSFVREGDRLYVTDRVQNSTDIGTVPSIAANDGGAITLLLSTSGNAIIADSTNLYFVDYASLFKVNKAGTATRTAIQGNAEQAFVILGPVSRTDVLYWIVSQTTAADGGALTHKLFSRTSDSTVRMRSDVLGGPTALAVDNTDVYWTDSSTKRVMRIARSGVTGPSVVAEWPGTHAAVKSLLLDGDYVYWSVSDDLQAGADVVIYRAPKCAGPGVARVIVATNPGTEYHGGLLADATYLYYGGLTGIWRVAK